MYPGLQHQGSVRVPGIVESQPLESEPRSRALKRLGQRVWAERFAVVTSENVVLRCQCSSVRSRRMPRFFSVPREHLHR